MILTVLTVPAFDEELACDRMWQAGARSVEIVDGLGDEVVVRSVLADDDRGSRQRLGDVPSGWRVSFEEPPPAPAETWRDHVQPIRVNGALIIRPAWLEPCGEDGVTEIVIEPGGSFGLGDHPTTRLSADAVWRSVNPGDEVLDVGCGSGALSIIAAHRGARRVVGIDISEPAVSATIENCSRNHDLGLIPDEVVEVSGTLVSEIAGQFDVVVANILAPTLISMADDLKRLTSRRLIISGILDGHYDHVIDALAPMSVVGKDTLDGWAVVELAWPMPAGSGR
ncbi:MAG: hypothetical protein CSA55_05020 [Ilumatobacter coccineus]|uniref:Ribosomal protein L11 methyltransferase n=1 Tax=Ilumatobacter coccineus TaxID=467094 RepID=A0A2G6K7W0_9ACTN|nr:MAG: hypothetical protein CSA55_05020 [Ilumatobacter coccineus]